MKGWQAMPEECCGNCKYFRQHYTRDKRGSYSALWCGHCTHPRLKNRRREETCPHWTPADAEAPRSP